MLRLNIRHTDTRIGIHTQLSTLSAHAKPATLHTDVEPAKSGIGITQATIEINSYPSRHSYGYTTMGDFTRERGQQGLSDIRSSTANHAQATWDVIDNGARKGDYQASRADSRFWSNVSKQRYIVAQAIPDPEITVHPSEIVGEPDLGKNQISIDADSLAEVSYNPGNVETYIKQKGEIRMWTTEGKYDIYA